MRARLGRPWTLVVALSVLAGCRAAAPPPEEGALEVVVPTETGTLDPRFSTRALDVKVTRLVHAGLVGLHPETLEPVPLVAEGWRFLEESSLEVTLRQGLRFHGSRFGVPWRRRSTGARSSRPCSPGGGLSRVVSFRLVTGPMRPT